MLTFILETAVDHFHHWLIHHTTDWHKRPIDGRYGRAIWETAPILEKGRVVHKPLGRDGPAYIAEGEHSGRGLIRILGYWQEQGTGGMRLEADLEFQIMELSPSRIQVWVDEGIGWPDTYLFFDLLKDIARTYPEARQEIEAWIEERRLTAFWTGENFPPPPPPEDYRLLAILETAPPQDKTTKPPEKPARDAGLDKWFEYYYEMKAAGRKYTLNDVAKDTGYSEGYIRQKKAEYDAAHKKT